MTELTIMPDAVAFVPNAASMTVIAQRFGYGPAFPREGTEVAGLPAGG